MPDFLSPKELARAANVSESSVKRWCDRGWIAAERTGGGHRRLRSSDAIAFLRRIGKSVDPSLLGMGPRTSGGPPSEVDVEGLTQALTDGSETEVRRWATRLFLGGWSVARICDEALGEAFRRIGDRWACRTVEVYQERRACGLAVRLLDALKTMTPRVEPTAPLAIGASPEGDPYGLPTAMCEAVLHEAGWKAQSLGSDLPFDSLAAAVERLRPRLFWLSVSAVADEAAFLSGWKAFVERISPDVVTVVGGRALDSERRRRMPFTSYGDDMRRLQAFGSLCLQALQRNAAGPSP
jgi:excisionase family DNA binding protein